MRSCASTGDIDLLVEMVVSPSCEGEALNSDEQKILSGLDLAEGFVERKHGVLLDVVVGWC